MAKPKRPNPCPPSAPRAPRERTSFLRIHGNNIQTSTQGQKKIDRNFVSEKGWPEVEIVNSDYQPRVAELEEDMRLVATFEEAVQALTKPVRVKYIDRHKTHG